MRTMQNELMMRHRAGCEPVGGVSVFCDPSVGSRLRYSHHPGTDGPQGCQHHHDLHARSQQRRKGSQKPD